MMHAPSVKPQKPMVKTLTTVAVTQAPVYPAVAAKTGLGEDTVSFQHAAPTAAQVIEQTQALLEQAQSKPYPSQKLVNGHKALENTIQQVEANADLPPEMKDKQLKALRRLQEQNKKLRQELMQKQALMQKEGWIRPASQVEQSSMKQLFSDLLHPDPEMAKSATTRLLGLGVSEEKIAKIQKAMQERKGKSVQFGGGDSLEELLADAQKDIINNNSMEQIVQAGVAQHVDAVANTVKPIMFGSGPIFEITAHGPNYKYSKPWDPMDEGCFPSGGTVW